VTPDEFDGPVQEQATGSAMAASMDLRPDGLGVLVVKQGPDQGGRPRRRPLRAVSPRIDPDQFLGDEPAEPGLIDFTDEGCDLGTM
jgi:hypothetical protein